MTGSPLIILSLAGPLLAGVAWGALLPWPVARRAASGGLALAANAAAWAVFWAAYQGDPASWRSFEGGLLGATVGAVAEIGIILAAIRVERTSPAVMPVLVAGLAVSATAVMATAYATNVALLAVALPLPTLAVAAAAVSTGRVGVRGIGGLAAADVAAFLALSILFARTGSIALGPASPLAVGLLLAAAAAKAGALPGVGTWRLTEEPGANFAPALRGQGLALAALAGLTLSRADGESILAAVASGAVVVAGVGALRAAAPTKALAAATGAAAAVPFVALGLGGGGGVRAFLVLVPPFLLGAAAAGLLTTDGGGERAPQEDDRSDRPGRFPRWVGAIALGVVLASILGAPPGGGFPGTWLTLALATVRGESQPLQLLVAGALAVGLTLSFLGVVELIGSAAPGRAAAAAGSAVAAVLIYVGTQPVRLGIGWWLRVEAEVGAPRLLGAAGAPDLPPIGGANLLLALAPAAVLVAVLIGRAGGLRDAAARFVPLPAKRPAAPVRVAAAVQRLGVQRLRKERVGPAVAALLGLAGLVLAVRLVVLAGRGGFL